MDIDLSDVKLSNKELRGVLEIGARFVRNTKMLVWAGTKAVSPEQWSKVKNDWMGRTIRASKQYDSKKNLFFELTREDIKNMTESQGMKCVYCTKHMQTVRRTDHDGCTIDRVDGKLGHTRENCVLSCRKCNVTLRVSEMVQVLRENKELFKFFEGVIKEINSE